MAYTLHSGFGVFLNSSTWGGGIGNIYESDLINCRKSRILEQNRGWVNQQSFSVLNFSLCRLWLNNKHMCLLQYMLWLLILYNVYGSGTWLVSKNWGFTPFFISAPTKFAPFKFRSIQFSPHFFYALFRSI